MGLLLSIGTLAYLIALASCILAIASRPMPLASLAQERHNGRGCVLFPLLDAQAGHDDIEF